jgi:hypothetical protein
MDQIQKYIDAQGKDCNRIVYIEYQYYQIGLTQKWLQEISAKIADPLTVRREILLQRLHGSSLSPFPQEDVEFIVETQRKPIDELWLLEYYKFDVYQALNRNTPYIIGVDCSTGTDGDNNAITILDPYTVEPVAEFECSYIGEKKYIQLLIDLILKHLPKAVLCIERNSVGDAIIDFLLDSPIRNNLYFDKERDLQEEKMKQNQTIESMLKKQAQVKTYYGVWTGKDSREDMMSILARHVNEYKEKFITKNIIRDLSRLIRKPNGRVEAGPGFHDDSIMSYLIALYVYYHGNNLISFGIVKGMKSSDPQNKGMKRAEEIDPTLVSQDLIREVQKQEDYERQASFEKIMRDAIKSSQRDSYNMLHAGLSKSDVFQNTPDALIEDENDGDITLDFFNSLNGF